MLLSSCTRIRGWPYPFHSPGKDTVAMQEHSLLSLQDFLSFMWALCCAELPLPRGGCPACPEGLGTVALRARLCPDTGPCWRTTGDTLGKGTGDRAQQVTSVPRSS